MGKLLLTKTTKGVVSDRDFIDPGAFIDDDGQAYLFVGQKTINAIKLIPDMISYDGEVHIVEGLDSFFGAVCIPYPGSRCACFGSQRLSRSGRSESQG